MRLAVRHPQPQLEGTGPDLRLDRQCRVPQLLPSSDESCRYVGPTMFQLALRVWLLCLAQPSPTSWIHVCLNIPAVDWIPSLNFCGACHYPCITATTIAPCPDVAAISAYNASPALRDAHQVCSTACHQLPLPHSTE